MGFDYIAYRRTARSGRYKLQKRSFKMIEAMRCFTDNDGLMVLDVGATDGFMLRQYQSQLNIRRSLGIEPTIEYIKSRPDDSATLIQGIGESIPFRDATFDVITVASVLDHMNKPSLFLKEARRVLKKSGIIIISLVHPFYDTLAVKFRFKEDDHAFRFTEKRLAELLKDNGFIIKELSRFALPFFGIPFEERVERILKRIGFSWCMFYILAVAQVNKQFFKEK